MATQILELFLPLWIQKLSKPQSTICCGYVDENPSHGLLRQCLLSAAVTMSEGDTAVASAEESKFFTYDGPNPKLTYPLKIIYCDGKYLLFCVVTCQTYEWL